MAGGIPDLSLDDLVVDVDAASGEFDADRGFRFEAELVSGESGEEIGFSDAGVTDQDDLEEVIVIVVSSVRHSSLQFLGFFLSTKIKIKMKIEIERGKCADSVFAFSSFP